MASSKKTARDEINMRKVVRVSIITIIVLAILGACWLYWYIDHLPLQARGFTFHQYSGKITEVRYFAVDGQKNTQVTMENGTTLVLPLFLTPIQIGQNYTISYWTSLTGNIVELKVTTP